AFDDYAVIEPGRGEIADRQFGDRIGAAPALVRVALLDADRAQHLGPRPLEPFQVVAVIDHAREVGILEVDAQRVTMRRSVVDSRRWWGTCGHDAGGFSRHATRLAT